MVNKNPYNAKRRLVGDVITTTPNTTSPMLTDNIQSDTVPGPSEVPSSSTDPKSSSAEPAKDGPTSYAAAAATTPDEDKLTLTVRKVDHMSPMTRDDIFLIQAEIATAEIDLLESLGPKNFNLEKSYRHGRGYNLVANSTEALNFYKISIDKITDLPQGHKGFKAYLPGETPPGHRIVGKLYRAHWKNRNKLHLAFVAGTGNQIQLDQVRKYRTATIQDNRMMTIFLEIDDLAFDWLRQHNWSSRIGGTTVPWRTPNVPGLTGVFRPDEKPADILKAQIHDLMSASLEPLDSEAEEEINSIATVEETLLLDITTTDSDSDSINTTVRQTDIKHDTPTKDFSKTPEKHDPDSLMGNLSSSTPSKDRPEPIPLNLTPTRHPSPEYTEQRQKITKTRRDSDVSHVEEEAETANTSMHDD